MCLCTVWVGGLLKAILHFQQACAHCAAFIGCCTNISGQQTDFSVMITRLIMTRTVDEDGEEEPRFIPASPRLIDDKFPDTVSL